MYVSYEVIYCIIKSNFARSSIKQEQTLLMSIWVFNLEDFFYKEISMWLRPNLKYSAHCLSCVWQPSFWLCHSQGGRQDLLFIKAPQSLFWTESAAQRAAATNGLDVCCRGNGQRKIARQCRQYNLINLCTAVFNAALSRHQLIFCLKVDQ